MPQARNSSLDPEWVAANAHSKWPSSEFVDSLIRLARSFLPSGQFDLALLSRLSGLSARSLQRQLSSVGLSFSILVDQVRLELARELVRDPRQNLIDIALELGYSDPANFTRAFKRWTGMAPRSYRHDMRHCGPYEHPAGTATVSHWTEAYRNMTPGLL
jgi:AraC-like DNA-binding protein